MDAINIRALIEQRNALLPSALALDASAGEIMESGKQAVIFGKASAKLCAGLVREAIRQSVEHGESAEAYVIAAFQSAYFTHGQKSEASAFITAVMNAGLTAQAGAAEKKAPEDRTPFESALVHCFREHKLTYNGKAKAFSLKPRDNTESAATVAARELSAIAGIAGVGTWPDIVAGIRATIDGFRNAADTVPLLEKIEELEAANLRMAELLKSASAAKKSASAAKKRASAK